MATTKKRAVKGRPKAPKRTPTAAVAPDGDTERRILDAARRVFTRRGSAGARMQEIAGEAGVNQALLHYYFRTKDALALAVFREAAGRLFPGILRILGADASIETRVEQVVHHYIDTLRENPFLPGYVLAELNFDPARMTQLASGLVAQSGGNPQARATMLAGLGRELARRAALGDFRPMTADQFLVNLASLCVFPFAARPMVVAMLGVEDAHWDAFLDARRRDLPSFILNALRA
jgi:AcrR family transcriptional regulator